MGGTVEEDLAKYLKSDGLLHLPIIDGVRLIRPEDVTDDDVKAIRKQIVVDKENQSDEERD